MRFTADVHDAIARGDVTLTFRRWRRPQVKVGGRYRVGAVDVVVDAIEIVPWSAVTPADVRRTGFADADALRKVAAHSGPIDEDTELFRIEFHVAGAHSVPPRRPTDDATVASVLAKLAASDARSTHGPWTRATLALIGERPGVVSTELAATIGRPRPDFKADVRKLKALGLTESLEVGYRLTPLGEAVVAAR